jgi:hypothetical protein
LHTLSVRAEETKNTEEAMTRPSLCGQFGSGVAWFEIPALKVLADHRYFESVLKRGKVHVQFLNALEIFSG